jgi:glycosyltransferase involved in cell wall biosynthesis
MDVRRSTQQAPRLAAGEARDRLLVAPDLSIIIPAYNEEGRLPATLRRIQSYLEHVDYSAEVIVVDDGSSDGTADCVRALEPSFPGLQLVQNPGNRGKGYSVRHGVSRSRGRYVLFTDADLSAPIEEADRLLAHLEQGWDVAVGSRDLDLRLLKGPQPWLRRQAGQVFHRLVWMLFQLPIKDTQCGFKMFRRAAALRVFGCQRIDRFGFDVEVLWLARRMGYRCLETPVVWVNDESSRVSMLRDGPAMLMELLKIRWVGWRRGYGEMPPLKTTGVELDLHSADEERNLP